MNKLIVLSIVLLTGVLSFGQNKVEANALIGKWELKSIEIAGQVGTPEEVFGQSGIYQIYIKNNGFESHFGSEKNKGSWKLSKDKTKITVTSETPKQEDIFTVKSFTKQKMTLEIEVEDGQKLSLFYEKQKL